MMDSPHAQLGLMPKYGIAGGMGLACSQPPELLVPIAKTYFLRDVRRAGTHFLVCNNGDRGVNGRAMGIG